MSAILYTGVLAEVITVTKTSKHQVEAVIRERASGAEGKSYSRRVHRSESCAQLVR